ncbi:hypothetical protein M434DRAFT_31385 [Hypoxylon sp. CO27-5]|nr:hypothetical protein M434DRAFT_31385 [Hypoxylon sp. CO27-5]
MSDSRNFVGGRGGAGGGSGSGPAKQTGHVGFGGVKHAFPAQYNGSLEEIRGSQGRGRGRGGRGWRGGRGRGRGARGGGGGVRGGGGELAETQSLGGSMIPVAPVAPAGPVIPASQAESGVVGVAGSSGKVDLELQKNLPEGLTLLPGTEVWRDYDEFGAPVGLQDRYNPLNRGIVTYRSGQMQAQADAGLIEGSQIGDAFIQREGLVKGVDEVHVTYTKVSQKRRLRQLSRPVPGKPEPTNPGLPSTQQPPAAYDEEASVDEEFHVADRVDKRHHPYGRRPQAGRGRGAAGRGYRGRGGRGGRGGHPGGHQDGQQDVTMADALAELDAQLDEYRNSGPQVKDAEQEMDLDYEGGDEPNVII